MRLIWTVIALMLATAVPAFGQAPRAPGSLRIITTGTFGLQWDYTDAVTQFNVIATSGSVTKGLATVPGTAMVNGLVAVMDIPGPGPGMWMVHVTAQDSRGVSDPSNMVGLFVPETPPPEPPMVPPCTYIPVGATTPETRPVGYLLIGRIIITDSTSSEARTVAARRVEQFRKWGWLLMPWPEIDVDGKYILRVRAWCREVPGLLQ